MSTSSCCTFSWVPCSAPTPCCSSSLLVSSWVTRTAVGVYCLIVHMISPAFGSTCRCTQQPGNRAGASFGGVNLFLYVPRPGCGTGKEDPVRQPMGACSSKVRLGSSWGVSSGREEGDLVCPGSACSREGGDREERDERERMHARLFFRPIESSVSGPLIVYLGWAEGDD